MREGNCRTCAYNNQEAGWLNIFADCRWKPDIAWGSKSFMKWHERLAIRWLLRLMPKTARLRVDNSEPLYVLEVQDCPAWRPFK